MATAVPDETSTKLEQINEHNEDIASPHGKDPHEAARLINSSTTSSAETQQEPPISTISFADVVQNVQTGSSTGDPCEEGIEMNPQGLDAKRPSSADDITKINRKPKPTAGFFKRQQSTISDRSSTAKQLMMKETKKFFGLDDCSKQAQLWEERRRRHACRSNGPLKGDTPITPGIVRQASQAPRSTFRSAVQTITETPSTSTHQPSLLSVVQSAQRDQDFALAKNRTGLKVDTDSALKKQVDDAFMVQSSVTPESFVFSDIGTEDEDVFDSTQSLHQVTPPHRDTLPEPDSRRESVAKIAWAGLTFAASKVVKKQRQEVGSEDHQYRSRRQGTVRPLDSQISSAPRSAYGDPANQPPTSVPLIQSYHLPPPITNEIQLQSAVDYAPVQLDPTESRFKRLKKQIGAKLFDRDIYHEESGILDNVIGEKVVEDDLSDYRPYFTYWVTTVQFIIMILTIITYEKAPFGFSLHSQSSMVLMASLSLHNVQYWEASNLWIGPRAADLIRLGAKYTPCMRNDIKIQEKIDALRKNESETGCCIRNDNSGCVQTQKGQCSTRLSVWEKWSNLPVSNRPQNRNSGAVCGQDPRYCKVPASIAPYTWSDDISKWPLCQEMPEITGTDSHMTCEIIGRPCCIGIHGECRIVSQEYCSFVKGTFHEEATLCSQISCLDELCGMVRFYNPDTPDQIYRLWLSLFIHAGIIHVFFTVMLQYFFMRDLEKMAGPVRIGLIYTLSGIAGNLASAIFEPHKPEVGPGGAHFGLLACLFVELKNNWHDLISPKKSLARLITVTIFLFLLGFLPWVDCWAHMFGFITGLLLSFALIPFVYAHKGDSAKKWKIIRIVSCSVSVAIIITVLFILFYVTPVHDCKFCDILNCIPFTKDFCAEQKIDYNKEFDIL